MCACTPASGRVPYAVRTAEVPASASRLILPLNAGVRGGRTEFDAAMPAVTYTDVELQITGQNFQAKVDVSGSQTPAGSNARHVGTYTIFDLTREKSGRNTVLHLPVSDYRYLHFAIDGPIAPDAVTGITVMAAPNGPEPAYTTVAQSNMAIQSGPGHDADVYCAGACAGGPRTVSTGWVAGAVRAQRERDGDVGGARAG